MLGLFMTLIICEASALKSKGSERVFQVLPQVKVHNGGPHGAGVLGDFLFSLLMKVTDIFTVTQTQQSHSTLST